MIEIHFEEERDAKVMYEQLTHGARQLYKETSILLEKKTVIVHIPVLQRCYVQEILIPKLVQFILKIKESKWMRSILKDSFCYEDMEEQNQILHIAHSILTGKRREVPRKGLEEPRKQILYRSLEGIVQEPISFSFESYVRFRLQEYMAYLNRWIELAIDEYKLEQEYQAFIETLRQQVSKRRAQLSCLHIVFTDNFIFYDEKGLRLKQEKLVQYIDEKIMYNKDISVDTNVIAPLLCIAPKTICLYTPHPDHNVVVTIQNVFQERVKLYSICEFEKIKRNL